MGQFNSTGAAEDPVRLHRSEKGSLEVCGEKSVFEQSGEISDASAVAIVKRAADIMRAAGIPVYVSDRWSDSIMGGLSDSSNTQNWRVNDGDRGGRIKSFTPKGYYEIGVSVYGEKFGIRFDSRRSWDGERETYEPSRRDADAAAKRIQAVFRGAGLAAEVQMTGYDCGFGTKNVDFSVRIKKAGES